MSVLWGLVLGRSVLLALVLVAGGIYLWVLFFRPFYITLAFLFTLPFGPLFNLPLTKGGFLLSLVFAFTGLLAWITKALLVKDADLVALPTSKPVYILIVCFLLAMVISLINTTNLGISLAQIKRFAYNVVVCFFVAYTIKDKEQLKSGFAALLIGYLIICLLGLHEAVSGKYIYSFLGGKSLFGSAIPEDVRTISGTRLNGPIGNPEGQSIRMITFLVFLLYPFFRYRFNAKKAMTALLMLLALANIVGTAYRGAAIGLAAALFVFFLFGRIRYKWLLFTTSAMLVVLIGIWVYSVFPRLDIERLAATTGSEVRTVELRKRNTLIGLKMALDHPIVGHGPEGFVLQYHRYSHIVPEARSEEIKAHNTYVQVLAEYGLVGFIVIVSILFIAWRNLLRIALKADNSDHFLVLSILAALSAHISVMMGTNLLFEFNFWGIIAIAGAVERVYRPLRPVAEGQITKQAPRGRSRSILYESSIPYRR